MKKNSVEIHDFLSASEPAPASRPPTISPKSSIPEAKSELSGSELILFTRTLGGLLEGGVPILRALEGLQAIAGPGRLKKMLGHVGERIRHGSGFADALRTSQAVPAFVHRTVHAGEMSGKVAVILMEISRYAEKERALRRSLREALIYPAFIVVSGFITLAVMAFFVLPRLRTVYDGFETELPWITKLVMALGDLFLPAIAAMAAAAWLAIVRAKNKKFGIAHSLRRIRFIDRWLCGAARARFARLLSLLMESGIPILQSLEAVEKNFSDPSIRHDIAAIQKALREGRSLSSCLSNVEWMDPVSRMLIASGEETGRLESAFLQVAQDTEAELEVGVRQVMKLIEPGLIFVIGLVTGFVVIGTMLPIFDMSGLVQ